MKKIIFAAVAVCVISVQGASAQFNMSKAKKEAERIAREAQKAMKNGTTPSLTNDEVIKGLKEALTIGSQNSAGLASKVDAYYKNPKLFIPFPPEAVKVATKLREIGLGSKVDEFEKSLNRAAELAAKSAAPVFVNAVKNMSITDGLKILKGNNDAATVYLKANTSTELTTKFSPIVNDALATVSATKYWSDIINTYNKIPGIAKMNPDLGKYATGKAIDGLFTLVTAEELKIRTDPAARVTDILKKVFKK